MYKTAVIFFLSLFISSCAKNKVIDSSDSSFNIGTDETLDIITWNIENFPKHENSTIDYLAEIIDSMDVDIIALQEIWGSGVSTSFDNLKKKLDGWDGYRKSSGLAYLYKTKIIINSISEINELNDIIRTPYMLSVNIGGQNIFILNNHLRANYNGNWDEFERREALEKLEKYISNNLLEDNVIILGDLNDELHENENNNVFQDIINDNNNYKFVDMNIAHGSSANWSYPMWPSHLDHIIITNELFDEFENAGSIVQTIHVDDYFEGGWNEYNNYVSDHRPVGFRLKFNP